MKLQNIYVILYNKMELTQPFWRLIKNYMIKTITFYQGLQLIFSLHPGSRQKGILFEFITTITMNFQKQPTKMFTKKGGLEIFTNSKENTCATVSFSVKLQP